MAEVELGISKSKLYPLLLLGIAKKIDGTTRFHKLMFILKQAYGVPIDQQFIRYHYGPFSSDLRDDIRFLAENNIIQQDSENLGENADGYPIIKTTYQLSEKGGEIVKKAFLDDSEIKKFSEVVKKWNGKPLNEVIAYAKSLL